MRKARPQPKKGSKPRTNALTALQARSFRNRVYTHFRARRHHAKQSPFIGSNRQLRGEIIRLLLQKRGQTERELSYALSVDRTAVQKNLEQMRKEGLLKKQKSKFVVG